MSYNSRNRVPAFIQRVLSVWYRHFRVYTSNFFSNAFPPFFEPLIFLGGLGVGFSGYIQNMGAMSYVSFLASGLIVTSAMYTATFECTYGSFVRLEHDMVYDGMLGAPLSPNDLILGELLFVGTKGFFFSLAVLLVTWVAGIINYPLSIMSAFIGFITGIMFGTLSLCITSLVRNMNQFNFYFTGLISPMFFFSGVVFPLENLPKTFMYIAEIIPLTHVVRLARAFCVQGGLNISLLYDMLYCILFIGVTGYLAIKGLKNKLIA
jgi:lipooligosaccharide transport system permease protein